MSEETDRKTYRPVYFYLEHEDITLHVHRDLLDGLSHAIVKSFKSVGGRRSSLRILHSLPNSL